MGAEGTGRFFVVDNLGQEEILAFAIPVTGFGPVGRRGEALRQLRGLIPQGPVQLGLGQAGDGLEICSLDVGFP